MIYNFNLGIGWASSGVEYAQAYRANLLRKIGQPAKFVFTDMFPRDNIEAMTKNIGFLDDEIIWLYTYFTDTKISPVTYTLDDFVKTFQQKEYKVTREGDIVKYIFAGNGNFYTCYMTDEKSDFLHRVEYVSNGCLIRKDYFTYCRIFSEYYAPLDNKAHMYQRRFFNEDGTVAYEEINDDDNIMYQFPDRLLCSKEELIGYMVERMHLTEKDIAIIDRTTGQGQSIMQNAGKAKIGIVVHADHFSESGTDDTNILWNNYYEYSFAQAKKISFFICATDAQNKLMGDQFEKYNGFRPNIVTIPVGSLDELKYPEANRNKFSVITASRLATEKHVDWLVEAVAKVHETIPEITFDIYGKGGEEDMLLRLIKKLKAEEYIHLMGQQNLTEVYKNYEVYFSASTSEGFGLTLLEAVGSGLPIIGFDVRYGNQNFIDHEKNGYIIPVNDRMDKKERVELLAEQLLNIFTNADLESFHEHSYAKAKEYLTSEVEKKWDNLVKQMI